MAIMREYKTHKEIQGTDLILEGHSQQSMKLSLIKKNTCTFLFKKADVVKDT